jgi:hypothetical protein
LRRLQARSPLPVEGDAIDIIFDIISVPTFWKILLFIHFTLAVALLGAITLQAMAVLVPARQLAGHFIDRVRAVPAAYAPVVVALYVPQVIMGMWIYIKYRTYVRIPMEQTGHWSIVAAFDGKEHVVAIGMALLPAYWYFWRGQPLNSEYSSTRKWLTVLLAFTVWYAFINGHVANDFRGVGS